MTEGGNFGCTRAIDINTELLEHDSQGKSKFEQMFTMIRGRPKSRSLNLKPGLPAEIQPLCDGSLLSPRMC